MEKQKHVYFKPRTIIRRPGRPDVRTITPESIKDVLEHLSALGYKIEEPAKREPVQFIPGRFYKSRDGRKIQLWAINKNSVDKPILGMILTGEEWESRYYNEEGVCKRPYGAGNDIVAEWSET